MDILNMILLALVIEAIVNAIKPLWSRKAGSEGMSVAEIVSMCIGIFLAVTCRINLIAGVVALDAPAWVHYIFYVMTGIALGRGPSFIFDLWQSLKGWQTKELNPQAAEVDRNAGDV